MTFSTYFRPAAILAVALSLAACGGKAGFTISGTAYNLQYSGLIINTNGMDLPIAPIAPAAVPAGTDPVIPNVPFSFANSISYGDIFNITITKQPDHQTCSTIDPVTGRDTKTDTAGRTAAIAIAISCSVNTYTIGGDVSGLTVDGVVLTNGTKGGTVTVAANASSYTFPNAVAYGKTYGVTVLSAPDGTTCTLSNASGTMGDAKVANINLACVTTPKAS